MAIDVAHAPPPVTDDAFLGGSLNLLQPAAGYRAGIDAVLLAAAVESPMPGSCTVLDAGAGVGTAGLCVARRVPEARVVLIEKDRELATMAETNVRRNGLSGRVQVIVSSIDAPADEHAALGLLPESFGCVIANPPFHIEGCGTPAGNAVKATANAMDEAGLARWCRFLARMTAPGGRATVIHKADALGQVLAQFKGRFGSIRVLPIHPREGAAAHRILVSGIKGSRTPATLLAGFVLHGAGNGFTPQAEAILRRGAALELWPAKP